MQTILYEPYERKAGHPGTPHELARGECLASERFAWRGGSPFRFDQDIRGIRAAIPKVQANATIGQLRDSGRDRAGRQIPSGGGDDRVARAGPAAIEDQIIPVEPVAGDRKSVV